MREQQGLKFEGMFAPVGEFSGKEPLAAIRDQAVAKLVIRLELSQRRGKGFFFVRMKGPRSPKWAVPNRITVDGAVFSRRGRHRLGRRSSRLG